MTCIHHWLLDDGTRNIPARCSRCGDERVFKGYFDEDPYEFSITSMRSRPRRTGPSHTVIADADHGKDSTYRKGCRCGRCRSAHAAYQRDYKARRMAEAS